MKDLNHIFNQPTTAGKIIRSFRSNFHISFNQKEEWKHSSFFMPSASVASLDFGPTSRVGNPQITSQFIR